MLAIAGTCAIPSAHLRARRPRRRRLPPSAKKPDLPEAAPPAKNFISRLVPSKSLLARASVTVFALGFVDAGYSGDWSRIGAVSRETEEVLKAAAYVVVPLCVFLIISLSSDRGASDGD
ncbi:unnamed protein product [Spirodela intermedia]|uniref:DUF7887 domain-containing protein n=1 Tax=Spirodela intermedia TaxID=51605 RepID=A0A7I8L3L7_SPIIN|nr:unnamed protein product [Spirodela intermedia]